MPSDLNVLGQLLSSGSPWIYVAVFTMGVLEGFIVTTFAVSGTIGFVVLGGLLARGYVDPVATILSIYTGTLLGDGLTFALSTRLQRVGVVSTHRQALERYSAPLALSPLRFIVFAHLTPYLKGVAALVAGGVLPWHVWLRAEVVGAFCGTLFFIGLGVGGTLFFSNAEHIGAVGFPAGVILLMLFIFLWVRALRPCRLVGVCERRPSVLTTARSWKRLVIFLVYYPFWRPVRWIEALLRRMPTRALHRDLAMAFPEARPGDIFAVRLHAPAPWGKWAHSAITIDRDRFCHGFGDTITAHRFGEFPVRYTIAHLRVRCDDETAARAGAAAGDMVGRPVSIFAESNDTSRFSCVSLVYYAYRSVGISLGAKNTGRIVPDDLFRSRMVDVLRIVFTEGARPDYIPEGVGDASHQHAGHRIVPVHY